MHKKKNALSTKFIISTLIMTGKKYKKNKNIKLKFKINIKIKVYKKSFKIMIRK